MTVELLKEYQLDRLILGIRKQSKTFKGLLLEFIETVFRLRKLIIRHRINLCVGIGGEMISVASWLSFKPSCIFTDTENARLTNLLSFRFAKNIFLPACYESKVNKRSIMYDGYHELAYMIPKYIGETIKPKNKFLVRFVGWYAVHDIGEKSLSDKQKIAIINTLKEAGEVFISSEAPLPEEIQKFTYKFHSSEIHSFMKDCKMIVGESATMASEAACLGIPAIFISNTGRGYTTEQDKKYGLIKHYRLNQWEDIIRTLKKWAFQDIHNEWQEKRWNMLKDKIDVTAWMANLIENYPDSLMGARSGKFNKYLIQNIST